LKPSIKKIPEIIRRYENNKNFQDELVMIKGYYPQTRFLAEETKKFIKALENREEGIIDINKITKRMK